MVGGDECAGNLPYGTFAISEDGSADGEDFYLSLVDKDEHHDSWLQIAAGDDDEEIFRIYWTFEDRKTLQERIVDAVDFGEENVQYEIVEENSGDRHDLVGDWRFSRRSRVSDQLFEDFGWQARTRC